MIIHHIPTDEAINLDGEAARTRCCDRPVRDLVGGDVLADPAWPNVTIDCPGAKDEAAELADAKARVETGVVEIGKLVVEALRVHKISPISLELAELRTRVEVLSDAAFGDGSIDQHGYELAVQAKFAETLRTRMGQADRVSEERAAQQRRATLLDGVTMRVPPPGGRP